MSPKPHFPPKRTSSIHAPLTSSSQLFYPTEHPTIGLSPYFRPAATSLLPHLLLIYLLCSTQGTTSPSRFDTEACSHASHPDSCVAEPNRLRHIQMQLPAPVPYTLNHFSPRCSSRRLSACYLPELDRWPWSRSPAFSRPASRPLVMISFPGRPSGIFRCRGPLAESALPLELGRLP